MTTNLQKGFPGKPGAYVYRPPSINAVRFGYGALAVSATVLGFTGWGLPRLQLGHETSRFV